MNLQLKSRSKSVRRAYELYEKRGREDGHDVEDWQQAEAEIAQQQAKSAAA